jgi:hypothetical protein
MVSLPVPLPKSICEPVINPQPGAALHGSWRRIYRKKNCSARAGLDTKAWFCR